MSDFLGFTFIRGVIVFIGQVIRYLFYKMLGSSKTFNSYSNKYKDDYEDLGVAMGQEIRSFLVGLGFCFLLIFIAIKVEAC